MSEGFLEHAQKGFLSTFLYVLSSMYHQEVRQREKTLISNVIPEQIQEASLLQITIHLVIGIFSIHFFIFRFVISCFDFIISVPSLLLPMLITVLQKHSNMVRTLPYPFLTLPIFPKQHKRSTSATRFSHLWLNM